MNRGRERTPHHRSAELLTEEHLWQPSLVRRPCPFLALSNASEPRALLP